MAAIRLGTNVLMNLNHYRDVITGAMASQITSLTIVYSIVIKENFKAPRHWPLCGEFTGHRWIPRTKDQQRGKCFHLMTSSWTDCVLNYCEETDRDPFKSNGLTWFPAWKNNYMPSKMWNEITYPFPNFNGAAIPHHSRGRRFDWISRAPNV